MKTTMVLVLALLVAQGCNPGRQTPPPAVPPPALPPATTTQAPDDRALQTLRDLGVTPETMVQLVRNQLAALPTNAPAPNQPPPVAISEPAAPAAPATPAAPAEPPPAVEPVPNPETVSATPPPPPAAEWPNATGPNQPATVEDANTENAQPPAPAAAPVVVQQPVTIQQAQDFYTPLNNYGTWVDLNTYGHVWQPSITVVNADWRPYCQSGRWIYTDCGWYWQSDYSWGWAAFHYGRWCYVDHYRWVWVPGTVWAPAWVCWRRTETHCGWAPLPPGTDFKVGVGFNAGFDIAFDAHFGISSRHYIFVPIRHFCDRNPTRAMVDASHVDEVYKGSTFIAGSHVWNEKDRRVHNDGPGREWSEHMVHQPTQPPRIVAAPVAPAAPTAPVKPPVAPRPPTVGRPEKPAAPAVPLRNPVFESPVVSAPGHPEQGNRHDTQPVAPRTPVVATEPTMPALPTVNLTPKPAQPGKGHTAETKPPDADAVVPRHESAVEPKPTVSDRQKETQGDFFADRGARTTETRTTETRNRSATPVVTRDVPAAVVPVAKPVVQPGTPVATEPTARDVRPVEARHGQREPNGESAAPVAPRRADMPSPVTVVEPRTVPSDKPAMRTGADGSTLDGEDASPSMRMPDHRR